MTIGPYEIHAIDTGEFALDGGAMHGVVPRPLWERSSPPDARNRITLAARPLLLIGSGRRVLIDTGNGSKVSEKLRTIYRIDTSRADLLGSLARLGVAPEDVTDVILTHLHFDHAGGSTVADGDGYRPTFPRARYHVQREHWRAALQPTERDRASFFPEDFMPLHERGVLQFVDGEGELLPGVRVKVVNGHTTALQCPVISGGGQTLFFCADLVPLLSHLQLPWIMAYDLRPLVTLEEKRWLFDHAVEEGWVLFLEHDPAVAAVTGRKGEKGVVVDRQVSL